MMKNIRETMAGRIGILKLYSLSKNPEYIKQEIFARIILYNVTETITKHTIIEKHPKKG